MKPVRENEALGSTCNLRSRIRPEWCAPESAATGAYRSTLRIRRAGSSRRRIVGRSSGICRRRRTALWPGLAGTLRPSDSCSVARNIVLARILASCRPAPKIRDQSIKNVYYSWGRSLLYGVFYSISNRCSYYWRALVWLIKMNTSIAIYTYRINIWVTSCMSRSSSISYPKSLRRRVICI